MHVSSLLTYAKENEYFDLLGKYKDVFAWSYQEIPGSDPNIVIHRLSIRKGVSYKKTATMAFSP